MGAAGDGGEGPMIDLTLDLNVVWRASSPLPCNVCGVMDGFFDSVGLPIPRLAGGGTAICRDERGSRGGDGNENLSGARRRQADGEFPLAYAIGCRAYTPSDRDASGLVFAEWRVRSSSAARVRHTAAVGAAFCSVVRGTFAKGIHAGALFCRASISRGAGYAGGMVGLGYSVRLSRRPAG